MGFTDLGQASKLRPPNAPLYEKVTCHFPGKTPAMVPLLQTLARLPLGPAPSVVELANESRNGRTESNPVPVQANTFLRAASGVRIVRKSGSNLPKTSGSEPFGVLVAQDSRRSIGVARYAISLDDLYRNPRRAGPLGLPTISIIPTDTPDSLKEFENDHRDYGSFRKKFKRDFESMTTLANGQTLILGSGSDIRRALKADAKGTESYRSQGLVLGSDGSFVATFDLTPFYSELQNNPAVTGKDHEGTPADLNIEGVTIRPSPAGFIIGFYNRGNMNGNGHNSLVEFPYDLWLQTLNTTQSLSFPKARALWKNLVPIRIVALVTPRVASPSDPAAKAYPVTLNDALFGDLREKATVLIPASVEAEFVDSQGQHHDGEVIFAGLMVWENMDKPGQGTCTILQLPGEDQPGKHSKFGKIEGLAAYHPPGKDTFLQSLFADRALLVGVTDVDSEVQPSVLSVLEITQKPIP